MKEIVWRSGQFKYRDATFAYVNQIKVAVVIPLHDGSKCDARLLLPGMPKSTNSFSSIEGAKRALEQRINNWFELVA